MRMDAIREKYRTKHATIIQTNAKIIRTRDEIYHNDINLYRHI